MRRDANCAALLRLPVGLGLRWRQAVVSVPNRGRMVQGARAADDQRAAIATELVPARAAVERGGGMLDGDGVDGDMGGGGDMFRRDAAVDDVMIVNIEVVDHGRLVVNLRHLARGHAMAVRIRVAKKLGGDEHEAGFGQAPVETEADGAAAIIETDADLIG